GGGARGHGLCHPRQRRDPASSAAFDRLNRRPDRESAMSVLKQFFAEMPIVAILRGLTPDEAPAAFDSLVSAGIRSLEVPLNSPQPFESLRRLAARAGNDQLIGAGTVLTADAAARAADAGARLIVAPNFDLSVIDSARALGLATLPGVATPSEA